MKGKLEFKHETQGEPVIAVYYNEVNAGVITYNKEGKGGWYQWGKIRDYNTSIEGCKSYIIELFNQLDTFIQLCQKD